MGLCRHFFRRFSYDFVVLRWVHGGGHFGASGSLEGGGAGAEVGAADLGVVILAWQGGWRDIRHFGGFKL